MASENPPPSPSLWRVMASALAAAFGVQSNRNRERDFQHGRPLHFILAGLLLSLVFIGGLILAVRLVLSHA